MARALETIERNAHIQEQLIADILDVSRIVTGKLRLELRPMELAPVVDAALDAVRPAAAAKGMQLEADTNFHGTVLGDPDRLQQVVWNLIVNAIKFTPAGGQVALSISRIGPSAVITVSDTGEGIQAELLPFIFDRFTQGDALGDPAARRPRPRPLHRPPHRRAARREGRGAERGARPRRVLLRASAGPRHSTADRRRAAHAQPLSGLKVLVVDDDPDARESVSLALAQCGAERRPWDRRGKRSRCCRSSSPTCWSATSACRAKTAAPSSAESARWRARRRRCARRGADRLLPARRADRALTAGFQHSCRSRSRSTSSPPSCAARRAARQLRACARRAFSSRSCISASSALARFTRSLAASRALPRRPPRARRRPALPAPLRCSLGVLDALLRLVGVACGARRLELLAASRLLGNARGAGGCHERLTRGGEPFALRGPFLGLLLPIALPAPSLAGGQRDDRGFRRRRGRLDPARARRGGREHVEAARLERPRQPARRLVAGQARAASWRWPAAWRR